MINFEEKLLSFIKKELMQTNPDINIDSINNDTDLSNIGVESIVIISLISQIEKKFKINISLSSLEKNNFVISIKTLSESISDERT